MSQYATLLAHSKKVGLPAVISGGMRSVLERQFPDVSIPAAAADCNWNWTLMYLDEVNQLTKDDLGKKPLKPCFFTLGIF